MLPGGIIQIQREASQEDTIMNRLDRTDNPVEIGCYKQNQCVEIQTKYVVGIPKSLSVAGLSPGTHEIKADSTHQVCKVYFPQK